MSARWDDGLPPEAAAAVGQTLQNGQLPPDRSLWPAVARAVAARRASVLDTRRHVLIGGGVVILGTAGVVALRIAHGKPLWMPVTVIVLLATAIVLVLHTSGRDLAPLDALDRDLYTATGVPPARLAAAPPGAPLPEPPPAEPWPW